MSKPLADLPQLLGAMAPVLNPGVYVFASLPHGTDVRPLAPLTTLRETEGISVVITEAAALQNGLPVLFRAAWITLTVPSDLQAVGLTATFAKALGDAKIPCNVIAGACHDHLFVPVDSAQAAMEALRALQRANAAPPSGAGADT